MTIVRLTCGRGCKKTVYMNHLGKGAREGMSADVL